MNFKKKLINKIKKNEEKHHTLNKMFIAIALTMVTIIEVDYNPNKRANSLKESDQSVATKQIIDYISRISN